MRTYCNRIIPDGGIVVKRNGITFIAHPTLRFDPVFGGGDDDFDNPVYEPENPTVEADASDAVAGKKKSKSKFAAAQMTKFWDDPVLGNKGLLG